MARSTSGYAVQTRTGKTGRTYHREKLIDGKMIVHTKDESGNPIKLLCDRRTVKVTAFID